MWSAQAAPNLRRLLIERENGFRVVGSYLSQLAIQALRLCCVAAMANRFDALSELPNSDRRQIKRDIFASCIVEECQHCCVGFSALAGLADYIGIH